MARVIWKGSISFGLVQIPVGLYTAEKRSEVSFSMLDGRDMSPIGFRRVNKSTGEEVPSEHIVKGYEVDKGDYVVVTGEDIKAANPEATQTVDILDFVDASQIDPMYFDKPYFLAPLKRGAKPYVILREVLQRTGKIGIAKVVIRTKQHLAAVMVRGSTLVLMLLRYAHELRSAEEVGAPEQSPEELGVSDKEIKMAERLVTELADDWKPEKYRDDYTEDLLALIEEKVQAGAARPSRREPEGEGEGAEVVDLMSLLKRSVEEADKKKGGASGGGGKTRSGSGKKKAASSKRRA